MPFCLSHFGMVSVPPPGGGGILTPPGVAAVSLLLGVNLNFNNGLLSPTEASCWGSIFHSKEVSELESSSSFSLG